MEDAATRWPADAYEDPFYEEAVALVIERQRASITEIQRKFRLGYNRTFRLVERMEKEGVVSAPGDKGVRTVLLIG